jgi:hypothetical protein
MVKKRSPIEIRCYRAESWMNKVENLNDSEKDLDAIFIFYWIAFNALYGQPGYLRHRKRTGAEKEQFGEEVDIEKFLKLLIVLDNERKIQAALTDRREEVNSLIGDIYLNDRSWVVWDQEQHITLSERKSSGFADRRTGLQLIQLFRQIYVLRKQVFHGCSSNKGSKNRKALTNSVEILKRFLAIFIQIVRANANDAHLKALLKDLPYPPTRGGTG